MGKDHALICEAKCGEINIFAYDSSITDVSLQP